METGDAVVASSLDACSAVIAADRYHSVLFVQSGPRWNLALARGSDAKSPRVRGRVNAIVK